MTQLSWLPLFRTSRCLTLLLLLSLQVALPGCWNGDENQTAAVSGRVLVDGSPLTGAVITFEPIEGTKGPKASAPVFGGSYRFETSASLRPGTYRVRISMLPTEISRQLESSVPDQEQLTIPERAISPAFDGLSQLTAKLESGENVLNAFEVAFR